MKMFKIKSIQAKEKLAKQLNDGDGDDVIENSSRVLEMDDGMKNTEREELVIAWQSCSCTDVADAKVEKANSTQRAFSQVYGNKSILR